MSTYVAFLRAVNVAGHAIISMSDVKQAFLAAGCKNVRTYVQSGNVLFDVAEGAIDPAMKRKIRKQVTDLAGSQASTVFRSADELEAMARTTPFAGVEDDVDAKFYVAFLEKKPKAMPKAVLSSPKEALDVIGLQNLDVFVVSRPKHGQYGFPNTLVEKRFGVSATTRQWSTVSKIVGLLS